MISLPTLFLVFVATTLVGALVAFWNSLRAAFGGGPGVLVATARDLPDHAALVEEKSSLLRAIKDLEYEHAVGKIGEADFTRLDGAYRARAKQVLSQLDRDVKPLYEEAERLIADRIAGVASKPSKKRRVESKVESRAVADVSEPSAVPELPEELSAEARAKVEEFVAKAIAEGLKKKADAEPEPSSETDESSSSGSER